MAICIYLFDPGTCVEHVSPWSVVLLAWAVRTTVNSPRLRLAATQLSSCVTGKADMQLVWLYGGAVGDVEAFQWPIGRYRAREIGLVHLNSYLGRLGEGVGGVSGWSTCADVCRRMQLNACKASQLHCVLAAHPGIASYG